jgi:hypothetical protein
VHAVGGIEAAILICAGNQDQFPAQKRAMLAPLLWVEEEEAKVVEVSVVMVVVEKRAEEKKMRRHHLHEYNQDNFHSFLFYL